MPEDIKREGSDSLPDEAVKPASPADDQKTPAEPASQTGKDVEGSSADDDKGKEKTPSLQEEIEKALVEESGKPLEEEPRKEPQKKTPEKPAEAQKPDDAGKPDESKKPEAEKKEDLYTVPEEVKEGTKAHTRFQELVTKNKEVTGQVDTLTQEVQGMRQAVQDTGMSRDEFSQLLDYGELRKKGDPREALKFIDAERNKLLLEIGEPIEPPELLKDYPDLQKRVTDSELSVADAVKLANSELIKKREIENADKVKTDNESQENFDKEVVANKEKVIEMEVGWAKNDLDWAVKKEILTEQLPAIKQQPPHLWPSLVQDAYDLISKTLKNPSAKGKPLNPDSPVGSEHDANNAKKEPKNLLEAIEQDLGVSS